MDSLLRLEQVGKTFAGFSLENISLDVEPGYVFGLIGPNGSGKTTTIRLIMGLLPLEKGSIRIFGKEMAGSGKQLKQEIGFVYDEPCLYEESLPLPMKHIISRFYENWDDAEFSRYMDLFELPADKPLKHYSQGMKMKYMTAIALSHHARLIIMDEPTSGLDPVSRHEILELLQSYISDGKSSVLFSTHITSDLERIADQICLLNKGRQVFTLPKDEVLDRYRIVKGPLDSLTPHMPLLGLSKNSFGFEGLTEEAQWFSASKDEKVIVEKCSLDDMMLYLTKRSVSA